MPKTNYLFILILTTAAALAAEPVKFDAEWQETYPVDGDAPALYVRDVWGPVTVRNGPPGSIQVSVKTRFSAPDEQRLERTRSIFAIDVETSAESVALRVGDTDYGFRRENLCRGCKALHAFDIRVPAGASVDIGSVNEGIVRVDGVRGRVSASNVNGPVQVSAAAACDSVESVNGDVELEFEQGPLLQCSVETINGDIRVSVPGGSDIDFAVDLNNGRIVSEFDVSPFALPAVVERRESGDGRSYRVSRASGVRIGRGGPLFSVASLNGDLTIAEISKH
ncbi:MAG: hypothetical protein AAFX10_00330 [Pseudomonadota bacterium]